MPGTLYLLVSQLPTVPRVPCLVMRWSVCALYGYKKTTSMGQLKWRLQSARTCPEFCITCHVIGHRYYLHFPD